MWNFTVCVKCPLFDNGSCWSGCNWSSCWFLIKLTDATLIRLIKIHSHSLYSAGSLWNTLTITTFLFFHKCFVWCHWRLSTVMICFHSVYRSSLRALKGCFLCLMDYCVIPHCLEWLNGWKGASLIKWRQHIMVSDYCTSEILINQQFR